jgi:hypothetical protein
MTSAPDRRAFEIAHLNEVTARLSKALYLLPALAAALALATPIARFRLTEDRLTLAGMVDQFSDLDSATGVRPVVVLLLICLWLLLLGGVAMAAGAMREKPLPRWPAGVLVGCGVCLFVLAVPASVVIDAADHVANSDRMPPFEPLISGFGMFVLVGIVTIVVTGIDRKVDS